MRALFPCHHHHHKPAPLLPVWSTPLIGCQPPLVEAFPPSQTLNLLGVLAPDGALNVMLQPKATRTAQTFCLNTRSLSPGQQALPTARQCSV